jgi:hypothetical protein
MISAPEGEAMSRWNPAGALRALRCYRDQRLDDLPETIGYKTFSKLIHTRAIPYALHAKTMRQNVFVDLRLKRG